MMAKIRVSILVNDELWKKWTRAHPDNYSFEIERLIDNSLIRGDL